MSPLPNPLSSLHPSDPELGHAFLTKGIVDSSTTIRKPFLRSSAAALPSSLSLLPCCPSVSWHPCQQHSTTLAYFPDPTQGPHSTPSRNVEIFRALLYLLDGGRKERSHFQDNPTAMRFYYLRQSYLYQICVFVACVLYLSTSLTEVPDLRAYGPSGEGDRENGAKTCCELALTIMCVSFFLLDLWVHCKGVGVGKAFRYKWTRLFVLLLAFDVMGVLWPVARVLKVSGIVRCFPIVYFSRKGEWGGREGGRGGGPRLELTLTDKLSRIQHDADCPTLFPSAPPSSPQRHSGLSPHRPLHPPVDRRGVLHHSGVCMLRGSIVRQHRRARDQ